MPRRLPPSRRRAISSSAATAGPRAACSRWPFTPALQAVGRNTIDAGIVATPTAGVLLRHFKAAGAIQITASHNPSPYNGLKLFSADGRVIPAGPGREVLERYRTGTPAWLPHDRLGGSLRCDDTVTAHLLAVLATVDAERIRKRRFRVVLDSNHGAGSILGRRLLHELACRVTVLGEEPDGQFAHPAEPTAENLAGVLRPSPTPAPTSASAKTPTPTGWP